MNILTTREQGSLEPTEITEAREALALPQKMPRFAASAVSVLSSERSERVVKNIFPILEFY